MKTVIKYGGRKYTKKWVEDEEGLVECVYEVGRPKNVLVMLELEKEDIDTMTRFGPVSEAMVYFGIARFNSKESSFNFTKKKGRIIAEGRAVKEKKKRLGNVPCYLDDKYVILGETPLSGFCKPEAVGLVLDYFKDIDVTMAREQNIHKRDLRFMELAGIENEEENKSFLKKLCEDK